METILFLFIIFTFSIFTWDAQEKQLQKISTANPSQQSTSNLESKMSIVGTRYFRILYALNATDIRKPETFDDLQVLGLGKIFSKYYSFFVFYSDSMCSDLRRMSSHAGLYEGLGRKVTVGKSQGWSKNIFRNILRISQRKY